MTVQDVSGRILDIRERVLGGEALTHEEGAALLKLEGPAVLELMSAATHVRERFKGRRVHLCAIVNAKCGRCPEDCGFCAQSVHNRADTPEFGMIGADEIVNAARKAEAAGARCFAAVTSGLTSDMAAKLKEAGLHGYHHNVETAPGYYPQVCTTHSYEENLETLRLAKRFGFAVCSGGGFGIGETRKHRVEMAEVLRDEDIDRVCLNFFMPVKGTRFEKEPPLSPMEILKTIAVYRLFFPDKDVNVCAGREMHLRDLQGMIFLAGASATMIGNYLTQKGRPAEEDLQLLRDLELEW